MKLPRTALLLALVAAAASGPVAQAGDRGVCGAMLSLSAQLTHCEVTRGPGDSSTYTVTVGPGRAALDKEAIEKEAARLGGAPGTEDHLVLFARTSGERAAIYAIRHDRTAAGVTVRLDDGRGPRLIRKETIEACGGFNVRNVPPDDGDVTDSVLECLTTLQPSAFTLISR